MATGSGGGRGRLTRQRVAGFGRLQDPQQGQAEQQQSAVVAVEDPPVTEVPAPREESQKQEQAAEPQGAPPDVVTDAAPAELDETAEAPETQQKHEQSEQEDGNTTPGPEGQQGQEQSGHEAENTTAGPAAQPEQKPKTAKSEKPDVVKRQRRSRATTSVRPTTEAECRNDPRVKHTLMVSKAVQARLGELQLHETMAAGRERPMWPHVDAALAVLHPDQEPDLAKWIEHVEPMLDSGTFDDYEQFGPLMRTSTRTGIRTLRVRLKAAGARGVNQHHVVTAALIRYLDAWDEQGRKPLDD